MTPEPAGGGKPWRRPDPLAGLALLLLALFAWLAAGPLPFGTLHQPGPGFFPRSLAALTGAMSLLLLLRGLSTGAPDVRGLWPDRPGALRVLLLLLVLLAYLAALEPAGYLLATAGLFLVLLRWVGRRSWPQTAGVTLLAAGGSYLLFARWLMVSLPAGLFAP